MPPAPATTSAQALGNLQGFQQGMQSPDQIVSGTEQSLGVPQAQQSVSGLRQAITNTTNLLNNVAPSVMGRTENSLVTSAQANRQIQNEEAPISKTLSDQTGKAGQAESDLQALLGKAGNLESLKASGQQSELSNLMDVYKALYGQEQDASAKTADAAKQAESVREFNASNSIAQQNANTSASKNAVPTATPGDIATAQGDLIKLQGADGYVSPQTYARVALQWANAGYSLTDFAKQFGKFKNPNNPNYTL